MRNLLRRRFIVKSWQYVMVIFHCCVNSSRHQEWYYKLMHAELFRSASVSFERLQFSAPRTICCGVDSRLRLFVVVTIKRNVYTSRHQTATATCCSSPERGHTEISFRRPKFKRGCLLDKTTLVLQPNPPQVSCENRNISAAKNRSLSHQVSKEISVR